MENYILERDDVILLVVDVQERLFSHVENTCGVQHAIQTIIRGFKILGLPIIISEQYPEKMGPTIMGIREALGEYPHQTVSKTTFSCLDDKRCREVLLGTDRKQWIVVGIEAHVCILQTAKHLMKLGEHVVVLNDAITSRSIYDYSTAIAEMRDIGVRLTSVETVLFELLRDSKDPKFKEVSQLIK